MDKYVNNISISPDELNFFIFSINNDYLICEWNKKLEEVTGYKKNEVKGTDIIKTFVPKENQSSVTEAFNKALKGVEIKNLECPVYSRNKNIIILVLNLKALNDNSGIIAAGMDISDINRAEGNLKQTLYLKEAVIAISTRFINIKPEELDKEIRQALKKIGIFMDAERCFIDFYSEDLTSIVLNYEWHAENFRSGENSSPPFEFTPYNLSKDNMDSFDRINSFLSEKNKKKISKDIWIFQSKDGYLSIPLTSKKKLRGILGLEIKKRDWKVEEENIKLLKLAGDIFVNVLEKRNIEENARLLTSIVENSNDAILSKDKNGIVLSWNKGAEKIYGYKADEMNGTSITRIIPEEKIDDFPEIMKKIFSGEEIKHYETIRKRKDGQLIPISLTVSPLKNFNGLIIGASTIARDITEKKRAEKNLNYRLEMEEIIANISSSFINFNTGNIKEKLIKALQSIGSLLKVDHCYIDLFSPDMKTLQYRYEWCRKEVKQRTCDISDTSLESFKNFIDNLISSDYFYVSDTAILSGEREEEKAFLKSKNIKSILAIPLYSEKRLLGFLGLVMEKESRSWSDEDIKLLKIVGEIFINVLERKKIEDEKEGLIAELKKSLESIKTLKGLLPICSSCKKIRDDKGYWHEVEIYINSHSEADFTHGICPGCVEKLYGFSEKRS